jgi:hypothetical protein
MQMETAFVPCVWQVRSKIHLGHNAVANAQLVGMQVQEAPIAQLARWVKLLLRAASSVVHVGQVNIAHQGRVRASSVLLVTFQHQRAATAQYALLVELHLLVAASVLHATQVNILHQGGVDVSHVQQVPLQQQEAAVAQPALLVQSRWQAAASALNAVLGGTRQASTASAWNARQVAFHYLGKMSVMYAESTPSASLAAHNARSAACGKLITTGEANACQDQCICFFS